MSYVSVHPGYTTWSIAFLPCPFNNPLHKQIWIEGSECITQETRSL